MRSLPEYAALDLNTLIRELKTRDNGLSDDEVLQRLKEAGPNELQSSRKFGLVLEFLGHFRSPLVIILLFASLISFGLGDEINALIIAGIVVMSAVLDFLEEKGAHDAAEKLRNTVRNKVSVTRMGKIREVFSDELCTGDLVHLNAGKVVPADLRIIKAKDFFVNQSALTGESFPVEKGTGTLEAGKELDELTNIALMGSSVVTGSASGVVIATGMNSYFGSIARKLIAPTEESSFSRGVRDFGYLVMRVTIILIVFIFLINGVLRHNWLEAFMFALAVAVGLTPELLTMIMSVSMARGSLRMARKGAIVKKLTAIPNFGSMDVLCTDKTGTLTQDKIVLVRYVNSKGETDENVLRYAYLNSRFQSGMKNPLDDALLEMHKVSVTGVEKLDEVPFDFYRKRMSVVVHDQGKTILISKGAPEEIMKVCGASAEESESPARLYEDLSREGFKVLAIATREVAQPPSVFTKEDEKDLHLVGFVAFLDPPKPGVAKTIQKLNHQGITVKIITGDNHWVAMKICQEIGLQVNGIMLGNDMSSLSDEALRVRAAETTLFARFSPDQKNRVIRALQAHHTVGYMGDGINDAPSLKSADVGISVNNATDVTKESADIILTRKSLMILSDAVMEGRTTFVNTLKYIQMGLSSNFGNMFSMAAAAIFLPFLPMLPVQILLNNFIYDFSQVTLPTDRVDQVFIQRPQHWDLPFLRRFMVVFGIISSVFDLITFYIFYQVFDANESQFQTAWFLESLTTQTLVIFIIRTHHHPFKGSLPSRPLMSSAIGCVLLGWFIAFSPLGKFLQMSPLTFDMIASILGLVFIYLLIAEMVKRIFYTKKWGHEEVVSSLA